MSNDFAFVADTRRRDLRVAIAHEWLLTILAKTARTLVSERGAY